MHFNHILNFIPGWMLPNGDGDGEGFGEKLRFIEEFPNEGGAGETGSGELGTGWPNGLGVAKTELKRTD